MLDKAHMGPAMVERSGITGTQVGGIMAVVGGFTLNTWLGIGGFVLALLSFVVTWHYKRKHYELALMRLKADLAEKEEGDG